MRPTNPASHPSAEQHRHCGECGLPSVNLERVALLNPAGYIERVLCPCCVARLRGRGVVVDFVAAA
jgi:hypothetical protein